MSSLNDLSEEISLLNSVNITSNVRAPGEYKYYYNGDNSSERDLSYLTVSSMWYTLSITSDHHLLSSTYNSSFFAQLFYIPTQKRLLLYIYKTKLDYRNENIRVVPYQTINLPLSNYFRTTPTSEIDYDKELTRIFFAANTFIILNDFDTRILIIDINTGKYITLFERAYTQVLSSDRASSFSNTSTCRYYNVLDVFDEPYYSNNKKHIRTYVFITGKVNAKKTEAPTISLHYIMIHNTSLHNIKFYLHHLDLGVSPGNIEPYGLKVTKLPHPHKNEWYFIVILLTYQHIFQYITAYGNKSLHVLLKQYSLLGNDKATYSKLTAIEEGKKEHGQTAKVFVNVNTVKLCSVIYFFEKGFVICKTFLYEDTPEVVRDKLFFSESKIKLDRSINTVHNAELYRLKDNYMFKQRTICAMHGKCLVMASNEMMYVFHQHVQEPKIRYSFYEEELEMFMNYDGVGSLFMLTRDKLFKFIYNERLEVFMNCDDVVNNAVGYVMNNNNNGNNGVGSNNIRKKQNAQANTYMYPVFEYSPESVFENYQMKLFANVNTHNEQPAKGNCVVCGKPTTHCCKYCNMRYYCSSFHYKYDFYSFHFFECALFQLFNPTNVINSSSHTNMNNSEDSNIIINTSNTTSPNLSPLSLPLPPSTHNNTDHYYITLYNNLITTCNKILNFIFTRIYSDTDYHLFLPFLICLINMLNNFGFAINTEEFNLCCNDPQKEKVLFYMECIFYYYHLNILKCTFALKAKLYNLTDCYLKIIKNELLPKLTRKQKGKIISPKPGLLTKDEYISNNYFSFLNNNSKPFFNIEPYFDKDDIIDLSKIFIIKHLYALSLLSKFKLKINSVIDVKETFVDISLMFEDHFKDIRGTRNIVLYCYFSICYHLVEIGKVPQTIKLLKRMVNSFTEKTKLDLKALSFYNLGVLQYAVGDFKIGIHNLETAYKLIVENKLHEHVLLNTIDSLALAYLNIKALFKAYTLIRMSIQQRKKIKTKDNEMKCIKLNAYLNYIIDLYEHVLIKRTRKRKEEYDKYELIKFVLGESEKELIIFEQNFDQFMKVVKFVFTLSEDTLSELHNDNPSRTSTTLNRDDVHYHERAFQLNYEGGVSNTSSFIAREQLLEKEENIKEYDEDIEIKFKLYDSLTKQQQDEFKNLNTALLKRDVILRDPLGAIEPLNINYHPIYTEELKEIIDKLKSNCLSKEIFYSFVNDKWRDDMYNCSTNNCLFGLAKYMSLENIKNMLIVERSKLLDEFKREAQGVQRVNKGNAVYVKDVAVCSVDDDEDDEDGKCSGSDDDGDGDGGSSAERPRQEVFTYEMFKTKFIEELLMKENESKELLSYLNLNEDYLMELYVNVFKNNPHRDFILQHPLLILNYIFTEVNEEIHCNCSNNGDNNVDDDVHHHQHHHDDEIVVLASNKSDSHVDNDNDNESSARNNDSLSNNTMNGDNSCTNINNNNNINNNGKSNLFAFDDNNSSYDGGNCNDNYTNRSRGVSKYTNAPNNECNNVAVRRRTIQLSTYTSIDMVNDYNNYYYYYDDCRIKICNEVETYCYIVEPPQFTQNSKITANADSFLLNYDENDGSDVSVSNNNNNVTHASMKQQNITLNTQSSDSKANKIEIFKSIDNNNNNVNSNINVNIPTAKANKNAVRNKKTKTRNLSAVVHNNNNNSTTKYNNRTRLTKDNALYRVIQFSNKSKGNVISKYLSVNCNSNSNSNSNSVIINNNNKDQSKSYYLDKTKDMSRSSMMVGSFDNGGSVGNGSGMFNITTFKIERPNRKLDRIYLYNKNKRMKEMQELEHAISNIKYH